MLGFLGGFGALVAWLISFPFANSHTITNGFTFGSFYGWFAHLMVGALIAAPLAFAMSIGRTSLARALRASAFGAVMGGAFVCAADALSDNFWLLLLRGSSGPHGPIPSLVWSESIAVVLALAVALATDPTPARLRRALRVGLLAGLIAFFLREASGMVVGVVMLAKMDFKDLASLKASMANMRLYLYTVLFDFVGMGAAIGAMLGVGENMMRRAWIRVMFARNETRDYPLEDGPNRIGSAEGIEVPFFGDPNIHPVHATIHVSPAGCALVNGTSAVGTLLNGVPIQQSPLYDGDEIRVGGNRMQFITSKVARGGTNGVYVVPDPLSRHQGPAQPVVIPSKHRLIDPFGNVVNLNLGTSTIGRNPAATVDMSYDPKVSRAHAQIVSDADQAVIVDVGSSTGTTVNGKPVVAAVALADRDSIKVGDTVLQYRI